MDYTFAVTEAVKTLFLLITINIILLSGTIPSDQSAKIPAASSTPQRMTGYGNTMNRKGLLNRVVLYLKDAPEKTVLYTTL